MCAGFETVFFFIVSCRLNNVVNFSSAATTKVFTPSALNYLNISVFLSQIHIVMVYIRHLEDPVIFPLLTDVLTAYALSALCVLGWVVVT